MVDEPVPGDWGRVTPLGEWPSRCLPEHSSARRNDPFHGRDIGNRPGDWGSGLRPPPAVVRAPAECRLDRGEALARFAAGDRVPALGAVEMHRVVSPAQAACVLGTSVPWAARSLRLAYAAGLVQGDLSRPRGAADRFTDLYRPLHPSGGKGEDRATREFWESLNPADYTGVFGGRERRMAAVSDRHAHLTAELLLRAAEHTGAACILGEMYTGHSDLFDLGRPVKSRGRGDGLIIRDDGLHIVVETTASVTRLYRAGDGKTRFNVSDKVRAWAEAMLAGGSACADVVVLFVEAGRPDSGRSADNWRQLRHAMKTELSARRYIESGIDRRFFAQRWPSWFPSQHTASEAFARLSALSPAGRPGEEAWVRRDLLDPDDVQFEVPPGVDPAAVIRNAGLLFGVPYWMRPDPAAAPDLEELAMRDMGFESVPAMPRVSPARQRADGGMWPAPVPLSAGRDARERPLCARRAPYGSLTA